MRKSFLLMLALAFGAPAGAQAVTIDASVKFPPIVQTAANLIQLLTQGVQVSFLTPTQQPAATLGKTGGIVVTGSTVDTPLPQLQATQVQVMTPIPGTTQTVKEIYPLAQPLNLAQPLSAQSIVVTAADGQKVPLTSVMGRQAAWAKAKGLQKKPAGMPPGQLKQLCKKDPRNAVCAQQPAGKDKGKK